MVAGAAAIVISYLIGSVPIAWLAGRLWRGIDIREYGSGNVGASNVWQSASRTLVVPVGLAQIGQELAAIYIARALAGGTEVRITAGLAAIVANDWNPWLRFQGGRGVGMSIGFMLAMAPTSALPAFVLISLTGVPFRQAPLTVAAGLAATPFAALIAGAGTKVAVGCAVLAVIAASKRLLANGPPEPELSRPGVWMMRLLFDRDIRDREAWVRRGLSGAATRARDA